MYKTQSENAQRLVHLSEQLRQREEAEKKLSKETVQLSEKVKKLSSANDLQTHQLREKDIAIQTLQDEHHAIYLELTNMERKNQKISEENKELLQRWIDLKNKEVEKMNEVTEFYEQLSARHKNAGDADVHCIAVSFDGSCFATSGEDKKVRLFDAKNGHPIRALTGAVQTITSLTFNPTNEWIAGSIADNSIKVWNLSTFRAVNTFTGHIGRVSSAKFMGDSAGLVTCGHDRTIKTWELERGFPIRTFFHHSIGNDVCSMDPDGQTLISGHLDGGIRFWDTAKGDEIAELKNIHNGQITSVSMSPDGTSVLTNSRDNTLSIIDVRTYKVLQTLKADSYQNGLNWSRSCFSPDGKHVAAGSADGILHTWDTNTGKLVKSIKGHGSAICGVVWGATGEYIYTAERNRTAFIWETTKC
ncbi:WD40-repeat-containing domain protein [Sporodiniella umbellata]|nr:WD40-repeat-containing domain protein [Sporodiniella umbellata]